MTTSVNECEPTDRSAGVPPAVAGTTSPRFGTVQIRDRGHLPHWEREGATYFVTFRLSNSLPSSVFEKIESEKKSISERPTKPTALLVSIAQARFGSGSTMTI